MVQREGEAGQDGKEIPEVQKEGEAGQGWKGSGTSRSLKAVKIDEPYLKSAISSASIPASLSILIPSANVIRTASSSGGSLKFPAPGNTCSTTFVRRLYSSFVCSDRMMKIIRRSAKVRTS